MAHGRSQTAASTQGKCKRKAGAAGQDKADEAGRHSETAGQLRVWNEAGMQIKGKGFARQSRKAGRAELATQVDRRCDNATSLRFWHGPRNSQNLLADRIPVGFFIIV
jgi:hypothetical protein